MMEDKICPMLAADRGTENDDALPVCLGERCAWWLTEYSRRIPREVVGGRCAVSRLALEAWTTEER